MPPRLQSAAEDVIKIAKASGVTLVTVESCTAGSLATLLADSPGAGDVFFGGFVTYAKACKENILGISPELIERYTAVSEPVARAMAKGGLAACSGKSVAVAITCVGGPEPDDDGNPVGLTHIATASSNGESLHRKLVLHGDADHIRTEVLGAALSLVKDHLGGA